MEISVDEINNMTTEEVIEKVTKIKEEYYNKYLYATADLENVRKQSSLQLSNCKFQVTKDIVNKLLTIVDLFETAMSAEPVEGYQIIYKELVSLLKSLGVSYITISQGDTFDCNIMEAISTITIPEMNTDEVYAVTQKGYKIDDKVIRYAKVIVVKN